VFDVFTLKQNIKYVGIVIDKSDNMLGNMAPTALQLFNKNLYKEVNTIPQHSLPGFNSRVTGASFSYIVSITKIEITPTFTKFESLVLIE